jgi:hypothetical protein
MHTGRKLKFLNSSLYKSFLQLRPIVTFFISKLTSKVKEKSIIIAVKELITCVEICEWTNLSFRKNLSHQI